MLHNFLLGSDTAVRESRVRVMMSYSMTGRANGDGQRGNATTARSMPEAAPFEVRSTVGDA
jgi:hypothetical protein